MERAEQIKNSLKREYLLYSNATAYYTKALGEFEEKYQLATEAFVKRFESGEMGDEGDYFDWYAFARLLDQWRETQSAIGSAIQ
jgi:hypothetical protein